MRGGWDAIRFVKRSTLGPAWPAPQRETSLVLEDGTALPTLVFEPKGTDRGTILFLHGMTVLGNADPRQVRAAGVLASLGYRVVAPEVPDLVALKVHARSAEHVAGAIRAARARPDLGGGAPLGVFSVSYSAGVCLVAAARPEAADSVASVCAIGSYADGANWMRFLVTDPGADEYGRAIVFYNFLHEVLGERPGVSAALYAAAGDMVDMVGPPRLPAALAALDPDDRALFERLSADPATQQELGRAIVERVSLTAFVGINPAAACPALNVPISLLHGATDNVIPPGESAILHKLLEERGAPSRMLITSLLTHGDTQVTPRAILESFELLGVFSHFFRAIPSR